jgi:hypothetical protein
MRFFRKLRWLFGTYLMPKHIATVRTENREWSLEL